MELFLQTHMLRTTFTFEKKQKKKKELKKTKALKKIIA